VAFSGSAGSWEHSPQLRARLVAAVDSAPAPILFLQAANDYSVAPAQVLSEERRRMGKPYEVKIYPPVGETPDDGHGFLFRDIRIWETDVFAFLDQALQRQ
jgi:hypothetical protein